MFINFAKTLFELLIEDEFIYIKQADNRLVYETEALSLYKDKGSIIYIVTIINAQTLEMPAYEAMMDNFSRILNSESKVKLIMMNIVVDDSDGKFTADEDLLPGKESYVFSYNVDLLTEKMKIPDEQPDLLGLEEKIKTALKTKEENYVAGTHLSSLQQQLNEKYSLPVRSGNLYLTYSLIGLNLLLWVIMYFSRTSELEETLIRFGAVSAHLVIGLREYYRLFTAMFVHIDFAHVISNCLWIYVYGSRVETIFGKFRFILIYILSGIIGNVISIYFLTNLSAGASGATFGLLGALLAVTYRTGKSIGGLPPYLIVLLCVVSIGMGFVNPVVNNYAHVGGFFTGIVMGYGGFKRSTEHGIRSTEH